jgi:hypothetical protein
VLEDVPALRTCGDNVGADLSGLAKVRLQGQLAEVWIAAEALQK